MWIQEQVYVMKTPLTQDDQRNKQSKLVLWQSDIDWREKAQQGNLMNFDCLWTGQGTKFVFFSWERKADFQDVGM